MKIFIVEKSGQLAKFAAMDAENDKQGGVFQAEWTVCYKIDKDGNGVAMSTNSVDEKHRGAGEASMIAEYFKVTDPDPRKSRAVQMEILSDDNGDGFGQDPPPSTEGIMSDTERERQREVNKPLVSTEDAPRQKETF